MNEQDPGELADELEREARDMAVRVEALQGDVKEASQDWQQKRGDEAVPGAQPDQREMGGRERGEPVKEPSGESEEERSPGPEAPPQEADPSQAEASAQGGAGASADSGE